VRRFVSSTVGKFHLGSELGRGGEGCVFELASHPQWVAKIYHSAPSPAKADKIRLMTGLRTQLIDRLAAWPADLISDEHAKPVGVLLPRVTGHRPVHELYNPRSRRHAFSQADWRFLVRTAFNISRAFDAVHQTGCVIGDVNHGGVLVADDATVRLIDCDSFQVIADNHQFLCDVGIDTFTPPELQGVPFSGVVRTHNHDNFGLAVLIFLLLFMGKHPFAGVFEGRGEMPINKAIAQARFAYSDRRSITQMALPPNAPDLAVVGPLEEMFVRAFSAIAPLGGRPTAREWTSALQSLENGLIQCEANQSHWYMGMLDECPWCRIDALIGISLFPDDIVQVPGPLFSIHAFGRELERLTHPGSAPPIICATLSPSDRAVAVGRSVRMRLPVALALAALFAGVWWLAPELGSGIALVAIGLGIAAIAVTCIARRRHLRPLKEAFRQAHLVWQARKLDWLERAGPDLFDAQLERLLREKSAWISLGQRADEELALHQKEMEQHRVNKFLAGHDLQDADIRVNGRDRAILIGHGILTAADVSEDAVAALPRRVKRAGAQVLAWRGQLVFDLKSTTEAVTDFAFVSQVEQKLADERWALERRLVEGKFQLEQIMRSIATARVVLRKEMLDAKNCPSTDRAWTFAASNSAMTTRPDRSSLPVYNIANNGCKATPVQFAD
jgi:DNA-binding helix-hairpin-helix protein with protein kinase domain